MTREYALNNGEKMHKDCEKVLFSEEQIRIRIKEIADEINMDYAGRQPLCIGILKGGALFCADLFRNLTISAELDFMSVSSYGEGTVSSGKLRINKDINSTVKGRDVIIMEDIIDSGFTLANLKALLFERGAATVKIATLLNKRARRAYNIQPDYNCFEIADEFVIGYGLDYAEKYRNLPYVGVLKREVYEK